MATLLTKSLFVAGHFCPELMFRRAHEPSSLPSPSESDIARMKEGTQVGQLARTYFEQGILIGGSQETKLQRTQEHLDSNKPLFEATFLHDRLLCETDIFLPTEDGRFDLIEVKMSTREKEDYLVDVAFQTYVLKQLDIPIRNSCLMLLDREYERDGELDLQQLFKIQDVTESMQEYYQDIEDEIGRLLKKLDATREEVPPGKHCRKSGCPLQKIANEKLPDQNVTQLYYKNGNKFLEQGITLIKNIPDQELTNPKRIIQKQAATKNKPIINNQKIAEWLEELRYPIAHIDFETINRAVPEHDKTKPFQQVPFQYSIHIEYENKTVHHEYLCEEDKDPREELLKHLQGHLQEANTLLAHNARFEKKVLKKLIEYEPEHKEWLQEAIDNLKDLATPFKNFWYYHPQQRGKYSIKNILPALAGTSYEDLIISDGGAAQVQYTKLIEEPLSPQERQELKEHLLEYCGLDTQGMVEILDVLRQSQLVLAK